jgi:hypothetical protein
MQLGILRKKCLTYSKEKLGKEHNFNLVSVHKVWFRSADSYWDHLTGMFSV